MKKKILAFIMAAATCFSLTACNTNSSSGNSDTGSSGAGNSNSGNSDAGNSNSTPSSSDGSAIELTVWGPEEDQAFLSGLIEDFKQKYSDKTFNIQLGVESESTAKDTVLTDPSAAADVFAFASDQLNELVNAKALANLTEMSDAFKAITGNSIDDIMALNIDGSVAAAKKDGNVYALPLGAGNNFFMFYNKAVLTDSDVKTWDDLLKAANFADKKVGMVLNSGWYNGGFFLGAGFTVSMNPDNSTNCEWNTTSASGITGVQVVEGMLAITGNSAFMAVADGDIANQIAAGELCAAVSGTWDAEACEKAWGKENVGCCKLPTFTCADKQIQQGCYSGFKLMGVNGMSQQVGWAAVLAEYLTNEDAQMKRYEARQLAPTNIKASETDAVKSNEMLAASIAQDAACGVIQDVGGNYWEPTKTLGEIIAQNQLTIGDTDAIQTALDNMVAGVTAPIA